MPSNGKLSPSELEAKLVVPDPTALGPDSLAAALPEGHRLEPAGRVIVVDAYFDSPAHDLMRAGLVFRVRSDPAGVKVTVKSLDRPGFDDLVVQRLELEGPVAHPQRPLDAAGWPEAVRARLAEGLPADLELRPIGLLRQVRDTYLVLPEAAEGDEAAAAPLAELSLDDVAVFAPSAWGGKDGLGAMLARAEGEPVGRFAELELELLPGGTPGRLRALAREVGARLGLSAAAGSKLERALFLLADHPRDILPGADGIVPEMTMAEAGRLMWRRQLATMLLNEAGARRGADIEYVHDMRVATRRARAVARLFGPHFKPKALEPFLKDLRRTARALGAVRDLDVALAKLRKHIKDLPAAERDGYLELIAEWRVLRRHAYRELLAWLDDPDYRRFIARFSAFCDAPGQGAVAPALVAGRPPVPTQVRHVMPSAILNRFEQVRAYEPWFEGTEPVPVTTLHALRIDCKALRYSLEPVEHLLGTEGGELVRQLKSLQDLLGDLNDACVTQARLLEMTTGGLVPEEMMAYLAHQEAQAKRLAARAPEAWRAFTAPENRRRLALAIAQL